MVAWPVPPVQRYAVDMGDSKSTKTTVMNKIASTQQRSAETV